LPDIAVSAIAALRAATWPSHQRLEKRLDIKARFADLHAYRSHLEAMWGFCAGLEPGLGREVFREALSDSESRRKLPLLTQDLLALGAKRHSIETLARCCTLPPCTDPATAFGCAYVIEGATLGGRTLLPLVHRTLGLTAEQGATFLASYGDRVTPMWQDFGVALDAWCVGAERQARATAAAVATFDALDEWLCGPAS
jgi:heme oxygenase (biliverdin-IX-beta and delta-forming)